MTGSHNKLQGKTLHSENTTETSSALKITYLSELRKPEDRNAQKKRRERKANPAHQKDV